MTTTTTLCNNNQPVSVPQIAEDIRVQDLAKWHALPSEEQCWAYFDSFLAQPRLSRNKPYVHQISTEASIFSVCKTYGMSQLESLVQAIVLLEWRSRYLRPDVALYRSKDDEVKVSRGAIRFGVEVKGWAYVHCSATVGDPIRWDKVSWGNVLGLGEIGRIIWAEGDLPLGADYAALAHEARRMLAVCVASTRSARNMRASYAASHPERKVRHTCLETRFAWKPPAMDVVLETMTEDAVLKVLVARILLDSAL